MLTDIALILGLLSFIYLLFLLFVFTRKAVRVLLAYLIPEKLVKIQVTTINGGYKEIEVDQDTAALLLKELKEHAIR